MRSDLTPQGTPHPCPAVNHQGPAPSRGLWGGARGQQLGQTPPSFRQASQSPSEPLIPPGLEDLPSAAGDVGVSSLAVV